MQPMDLGRCQRTAYQRAVYVEVDVPSAYQPETNALVDLGQAVIGAIPRNDDIYSRLGGSCVPFPPATLQKQRPVLPQFGPDGGGMPAPSTRTRWS